MNPSKCKYLIASKKRCALDPPTQLLLDGKVLEEVSSYRYLALPLALGSPTSIKYAIKIVN